MKVYGLAESGRNSDGYWWDIPNLGIHRDNVNNISDVKFHPIFKKRSDAEKYKESTEFPREWVIVELDLK
jgi:hypothetical protein